MVYTFLAMPGRKKSEPSAQYNARQRAYQQTMMDEGRTAADREKNVPVVVAGAVVPANPTLPVDERSITPLLPKAHDVLLEAYAKYERGEIAAKDVNYLSSALRAASQAVRTAQNVVLRTDVQMIVDLVWPKLDNDTKRKLVRILRGIDAATILQ